MADKVRVEVSLFGIKRIVEIERKDLEEARAGGVLMIPDPFQFRHTKKVQFINVHRVETMEF